MQRMANIDVLRGLASLSVCWFHLTNQYSQSSFTRISGSYGWLGVEIFFVISGFIIPYALYMSDYSVRQDWKTFIFKRSLRIEPPYLIAVAMTLLLWHASTLSPNFQGDHPPAFTSLTTLLHLGYLNDIAGYRWLNPVFWTLAIEFQFYILVSFVFFLLRGNRYSIWLTNFTLLLAALLWPSSHFVAKYLGLFVLGIVAFQYRVKLVNGKTLLIFLFAAGASTGFHLGWMIACVGIATSVLIALDLKLSSHRILIWLGSISYSLYLVHVPIGGRVVNLGRRFVQTETAELFLSLAALAISLVAAHAFYLAIEKPSQKLASRLRYRRS